MISMLCTDRVYGRRVRDRRPPDTETAAAVALTVNASGPVALKTTLLLTPEEVDAAAKQSVDSRQPVTGRPGETAAPPRPVAASSPPT